MALYVDGGLSGTNPQTQQQPYDGYWRVGGDTTWGGNSSDYFQGTIDEVAVYSSVLAADASRPTTSPEVDNREPGAGGVVHVGGDGSGGGVRRVGFDRPGWHGGFVCVGLR